MSLPGLFPTYPDSPIKFHVSLAMPGPISEISKSIGMTANSSLLLPNIDYITKFVNGDIGIADSMKKSMMLKNINKCKDEESFKQFAKLVKLDIPDPSKYKTKNGYSIPKDLISLDPSNDLMGVKAMEKTILKSIFETQKPYIEIAKLVIDNIAKVEDIIARFMPILAPLPTEAKLTVQSEKPKTNAGITNGRPKAIGYKSGEDIKSSLGKLQSLSKKSPTKTTTDGTPESNSTDVVDGDYRIISTVYSTGVFDPSIEYKYTYKDVKDDSVVTEDSNSDLSLEDDDPYKKLKPKKVIFGIFNSKGEIINPMTKLKTLDQFGNEADTPFYVADWITRSDKWYFPNNIASISSQYNWPRFGSPFYYWERYGGADIRRQQSKPDAGGGDEFTRKKYEDGLRKGEYIVDFTGTNERNEFIDYFTDLVSKKINSSPGLDPDEKSGYINEVISKLDVKDDEGTKRVGTYTLEKTQIDNHIDNAFKYGILNASTFVNPNNQQVMDIPSGLKYPFKPSKLKISGSDIWMDPESDYDLKVIKVDSALDIRYEDAQGSPEVETQILSFIKNSLSIDIDNNKTKLPFSISVTKNQEDAKIFENITEYQLDNWNYDDVDGLSGPIKPELNNNNSYKIETWRYDENPYFVGKNNITFPLQNNIYIEMERQVNDSTTQWSYREYSVTSTTETISPIPISSSTAEYNIEGSPTLNGEIVTKVTIQTLQSASLHTSRIIRWYYKKSTESSADWHNDAPASWNENNFSIDWQTIETTSIANGSLPQTRLVNSSKFHIGVIPGATASSSIWQFDDIKVSKELRTYIQVANGEKTLDDKSLIEVDNYKVKRWIVWRSQLDLNTVINEKAIMPGFRKNNSISLLYNTFGNNETFDISVSTIDIPAFQVRVKDTTKYGKMIDPSKITNNHLTHPELYSQGKYGGTPQEVGIIKRYMKTELDTETYYIVEGILIDDNVQSGIGGSNQNAAGIEWYRMPNALGATKVFLSMLADIFSKLVPAIKKLLELFKNPASFITDIISQKLGESFLIFSPESMDVMKKLPSIAVGDRANFIKKSVLSNYISVSPDGSYKFLLDGSGLMKLPILGNTITFGMQLSMLKPLISLISSVDFNDIPNKTLDSFLNKDTKPVIDSTGNIDLRADQNSVKNTIVTESNGKQNTEEVSIQYSTGKFVEGVDYKYIYLTEYVAKLVKEADELEQTNDPDNIELAKAKLELALKSDPKNPLLQSKFDDLFKKSNNYIQPILKFLIEIVSLPIKIIAGIIQWLMDFFKSLSKLPELPSKMSDLLSFQWIMDFFKPTKLLELAGIKFDIPKLIGWVSNLKNFPKDYEFDLSEVIDIALIAKMPKVKKDQFLDMLKKPFRILYSILCLLEGLINGIIDFVWSTLGIEAIIPAPHIKLCNQLNEPGDMSTEDIMDILNGLLKDPTAGANGGDYNFIYEVKLSDGRSIRDLNQEDLKKFVEDNKDVSFDFLFS